MAMSSRETSQVCRVMNGQGVRVHLDSGAGASQTNRRLTAPGESMHLSLRMLCSTLLERSLLSHFRRPVTSMLHDVQMMRSRAFRTGAAERSLRI